MRLSRMCLMLLLICPGRAICTETLSMATSNGPPYMIQSSGSGLDIDIPREALRRAGYELTIRYMPLARARVEVQSRRIDLTAPFFTEGAEGLYLSEPHVMYRPTAFSLASRNLKVNTLQDLKGLRVQTFQGASSYFGQEYVEMTALSLTYEERPDMSRLVLALASGRTDIVVLDYNIFSYFWNRAIGENQKAQLRTHPIFPPVAAVVAFNNAEIRDKYNNGLRAMIRDGTHLKLTNRHIESLPVLK